MGNEFDFALVVSFYMFIGLMACGVLCGIAYGLHWLYENIWWERIGDGLFYPIRKLCSKFHRKKKCYMTRREYMRYKRAREQKPAWQVYREKYPRKN